MPTINLLYVITKLELGGAQKELLSLISNLDKHRFQPFLFTARNGLLLSEALSINGLRLKRAKWLGRPINPWKDILALFEIYRFIKKNDIQIVHTHTSKAGILGRWAARLAKVKFIIHTVHGWSFNDYQPFFIHYIFVWLERLTAQFTHKLIVVSYSDKQKGLRNCIGREDKYVLIRYGIDYAEFFSQGQKIKKELGINADTLVVGMISCLKPQKSPQDFIKLASLINEILPDVKFVLVGDGILRRKVERSISKFNLQRQVILTGWRRDIPSILSGIDVFVLTSLWEGLPISVLEAMATSKPVVATHTGGIAEVVSEGKTGFLVHPRDINKFTERLTGLLKDKNLRKTIGQNAKNALDFNFTIENMVKNIQALYENSFRNSGVMC